MARRDPGSTTGTAPQFRLHMIIAAAARSVPGSQNSTSVVMTSFTFILVLLAWDQTLIEICGWLCGGCAGCHGTPADPSRAAHPRGGSTDSEGMAGGSD
jgi:hypothetical protein